METQNFTFDKRKSSRIINRNPQWIIELEKEIESNELADKILGKIIDYSLGGWGLIIMTKIAPKVKEIYHLNLNQSNSESQLLRIQIKWCEKLDNKTFRIGVQSIM